MNSNVSLNFDIAKWRDQLESGQFHALSENFLDILQFFEKNTFFAEISEEQQQFINSFVSKFLDIFTSTKFKLPKEHINHYIASNLIIANLTAISTLCTTDSHLQRMVAQGGSLAKILTLLNARCSAQIDRNIFFNLNPSLASLWYNHYARGYYGALQNQIGYENLRSHFRFTHPNFILTERFAEMYFGSTYAGDNLDRQAKATVNRLVKSAATPFQSKPIKTNTNKIALISSCWTHGHSVHRNYVEFIRSIKDRYHITFYPLEIKDSTDTSLFDDVIPNMTSDIVNATRIQEAGYQVIIFPDIGMSESSIALANMRLAPIQIAMLGHSVSTYGAEIDYFFSGASVEIPEHPEQNYSERLILLPGMGVIHEPPRYQFQGLKKEREALDPIIINVLALSQKLNYPFVQTLLKILEKTDRKLIVRFFLGSSSSRSNDHIPFCRNMAAALGQVHTEFFGTLEYTDYMAMIENGDLTLDSYPFGGCNTVSDSLFAHVPMVSWASDKWYGRIGAEMLRRAGLSDCAANSEEEFIAITIKLINDDNYRKEVQSRVKKVDINSAIYDKTDSGYFRKAFNYLIDNHELLKQQSERSPIYIGDD